MARFPRNSIFLRRRSPEAGTNQRGSVLLIVVVLLLLASLFVVFALNVGRFEQRTSGNDLRAKLAQELADAGVAQGVEYFNANREVLAAIDTNWVLCGATETAFPCGGVTSSRRGSMYAYHTTGTDGSAFAHRLVPIPQEVTVTGGFAADQQVGAVLCRVKIPTGPGAATDCATNDAEASSTWVLTVVSKGMLTDEGSSATVTQTVGAYNIFSFNPGNPPLVASGSVSVGGGLQIVAAPNAGGTADGNSGVPVSVWTRLALTKSGTPNTCYLDDFLRQGGSSSGPEYYEGITVCHTCQCPGDAALSYPKSGSEACQGMDIVDIDNNEPNDCGVDPNLDIKREEFPQDLFAFVFGQKAWNDIDRDGVPVDGDCTFDTPDCHFAEARRISECTYPDPATGASVTATLPEDTCFLLNISISKIVHIGDGVNDAAECSALEDNLKANGDPLGGLIWVHPQSFAGMPGFDCVTELRNADQLGSPTNPVGLIYDGTLTQVHFQLYGLLFVREPNDSTTLDQSTGGSAVLGLNAGATIYGAAVVQGEIASGGGGTAAIVYNKDVLFALVNNPNNFSPASLPGSWTDRLRY